MKKLLLITFIALTFSSCISLKFPDKMNINITVPEDYDIEKFETIIDTIKSQAKDKYDLVLLGSIIKKEKSQKKKKN